jgi:hypothetical protein
MVLVFLCLGGWLPSHHRRDTCSYGAAPMETRWTWLRAADVPIFLIGKLDYKDVCCDARGMANYLGTRRRHVDFLTVISSGCRTR